MSENIIYISNDAKQNTTSVDYNVWLKRVDTQLNEIQQKSSKLLS